MKNTYYNIYVNTGKIPVYEGYYLVNAGLWLDLDKIFENFSKILGKRV